MKPLVRGAAGLLGALALLAGPALAESASAPAGIYCDDPQAPWNRIFELLYSRVETVHLPAWYDEGPAELPEPTRREGAPDWEWARSLEEHYRARFASGYRAVDRVHGGDLPDFHFSEEVGFLLEEPRFGRLEALLRDPRAAHAEGMSLEARILFQQDLWNRFDALHILASGSDGPARERAAQLVDALGGLLARISPPRSSLAALEASYAALAAEHDLLDPALFLEGSPWRQLVVDSPDSLTSLHAARAGHRRVFRAFVRVPEPDCLDGGFESAPSGPGGCVAWGRWLPPGSRAQLVETLLAVDATGELVDVPLVVSVEIREVRPPVPGADGRFGLDDLPFRVLHGSRRDLARRSRPGEGLHELVADTLVPPGFSAVPRGPSMRMVPLGVSCTTCHGADGRSLGSSRSHEPLWVKVLKPTDPTAIERVASAKRERADYRALLRFFTD